MGMERGKGTKSRSLRTEVKSDPTTLDLVMELETKPYSRRYSKTNLEAQEDQFPYAKSLRSGLADPQLTRTLING